MYIGTYIVLFEMPVRFTDHVVHACNGNKIVC